MEETPRNTNRQPELQIDNVLSSQPELGPHIPDGGYGWVIFTVSLLFKLFTPSLLVSYGIFILFLRLENDQSELLLLWDSPFLYAPLFYIATYTFFEPWSLKLITDNRWPKFVAYSGVCLICAGFLILWFAIHKGISTGILFVLAGFISGMGASIVTLMCDTLLSQYFKLKLTAIQNILRVSTFTGYVLTPILLGGGLADHGILKGLIWYQVIVLQGSVLSMVFKKPKYLKGKTVNKSYKLIQVSIDDEEDIFSKPATELGFIPTSGNDAGQNVRSENISNQREQAGPSTNGDPLVDVGTSTSNDKDWETFNDEDSSSQSNKTKQQLHYSFAKEFKSDLEKIDNFEDDFVHIPKPLYHDVQINNNTSYSYEAFDDLQKPDDTNIFTTKLQQTNKLRSFFEFMEKPKFYMLLVQNLTAKFSVFIFFSMFPSYVYSIVDLNVHYTTQLLGIIATIGLLYTIFTALVHTSLIKRRELILAASCLFGCFGYVIIALLHYETWLIIGAAGIYISISTMDHLGEPLIKLHLRGDTNRTYLCLCAFTGLAFSIFIILNISYRYIFVFMGALHLLCCITWSTNLFIRRNIE